jgi:fluoride exporter
MTAPFEKPTGDERSGDVRQMPAQRRPAASTGSRRAAAWLYTLVGIGSALGGLARYGLGLVFAARVGEAFPWGTIFINTSGSFIIGFFATLTGPDGRFYVRTPGRQFVMTGFCGGYTTFSSFALETLVLVQGGQMLRAGANVVASLALCLAAVWMGHAVATALNR